MVAHLFLLFRCHPPSIHKLKLCLIHRRRVKQFVKEVISLNCHHCSSRHLHREIHARLIGPDSHDLTPLKNAPKLNLLQCHLGASFLRTHAKSASQCVGTNTDLFTHFRGKLLIEDAQSLVDLDTVG